MQQLPSHRILILDFGSQYTQLIARRVRELGVYSEIVDCESDIDAIQQFKPSGIILSGGPESVTVDNPLKCADAIFTLGCPVLGICYGMQTMVTQLGGTVASVSHREFGFAKLDIVNNSLLFNQIHGETDPSDELNVWMSHGDAVTSLPNGFETTAHTASTPIAAIADYQRQFYGLQFHPEVTHTQQGQHLLSQFVKKVCQCDASWTPENIIDKAIEEIRATVGDEQILVGLSGGVDSSVVAALIHRAVGDQLTCVFVDNGLLRKNEGDQVMQLFADHMGVRVIRANAQQRFINALKGHTDPESKRKICGEQFIRVFETEAKKLKGVRWLGQGTIYPDVIESAKLKNGKAHVIKSHHNVGGLPEDMQFKLIEPLKDCFKDEVRKIGLALGLPPEVINRHPFPGPGLCVRILEEIKPEYIQIVQEADHIFIEELRKHQLYDHVGQAFAVFLPIKSVGVKGDARCYEHVIALRAVETTDFMTAHWAHLPYDFLGTVSDRIMNEVPHVARVVYDISGKPPATIEWE